MNFDEVPTPIQAAHVLWHFSIVVGPPAMEPGSFTAKLIATIAAADPENAELLARGFPGYVAAVKLAQYVPDGMAFLRHLASAMTAEPRREVQ